VPFTSWYSEQQRIMKMGGRITKVELASGVPQRNVMGDNFYDSGVKSADDPRFQETFESVYTDPSLMNMPYYVVLGNHDWGGNTSAQIAYSAKSKRWVMPDLYYKKTFSFNGGAITIDAVFIDTVSLAGNSDDLEDEFGELPGPKDPKLAATQWEFIEGALNSSTANYLVVVGHYPVYSAGEHGPTTVLVNQLKPMLIKYGAHYFSGHDHDLSHISDGTGVNYIVIGAGDNCCYAETNLSKIPKNSLKWGMFAGSGLLGGFGSFVATAKTMTVNFYASNGTTLYSTEIPPRSTIFLTY